MHACELQPATHMSRSERCISSIAETLQTYGLFASSNRLLTVSGTCKNKLKWLSWKRASPSFGQRWCSGWVITAKNKETSFCFRLQSISYLGVTVMPEWHVGVRFHAPCVWHTHHYTFSPIIFSASICTYVRVCFVDHGLFSSFFLSKIQIIRRWLWFRQSRVQKAAQHWANQSALTGFQRNINMKCAYIRA